MSRHSCTEISKMSAMPLAAFTSGRMSRCESKYSTAQIVSSKFHRARAVNFFESGCFLIHVTVVGKFIMIESQTRYHLEKTKDNKPFSLPPSLSGKSDLVAVIVVNER